MSGQEEKKDPSIFSNVNDAIAEAIALGWYVYPFKCGSTEEYVVASTERSAQVAIGKKYLKKRLSSKELQERVMAAFRKSQEEKKDDEQAKAD